MEVVTKGGQRSSNDLAGHVHYVLQQLSAGAGAASIVHSDAASMHTLSGATE